MTESRAELWRNVRYGGAAFALGMPTIPLVVHLPTLYAEEVGLGLALTGVVLFLVRLVDVVTDPVIGLASDRIKLRRGHRKVLIATGAIIGAIGIAFLLNPIESATAMYLALWSSLLYLGWTLVNIPYLSWGADLSSSYEGRTRVTSVREMSMLLGILFAGAVPVALISFGSSEMESLSWIGWMVIAAGAVSFPILLTLVDEPAPRTSCQDTALVETIKDLTGNYPFKLLIAAWFFNSLANGVPAVLFLLYMEHVLGAAELTRGVMTFAYFCAGIVGVPLWERLSRHLSKHTVWCIAMLLACLSFSVVPFLGPGQIGLFSAIVVISGLCLGADHALPPSIQADVAEYTYAATGNDSTDLMFSLWSMSTKLALAVAVLLAFSLLDWLGTPPEEIGNKYDPVVLALIYAALPIVLKVGSIVLVWRYPLSRSDQEAIKMRLSRPGG